MLLLAFRQSDDDTHYTLHIHMLHCVFVTKNTRYQRLNRSFIVVFSTYTLSSRESGIQGDGWLTGI